MQTYRALFIVLALAVLCLPAPAFAKSMPAPPYLLTQQPLSKVNGKPDPTGKVKLILTRSAGGKPIWTMTVAYPQELTWSANGRELALWYQDYPAAAPPSSVNLLVWHEGHPVQTFHSAEFNTFDALWGFQFSPDGNRVAFFGGAAGGIANNSGTLYAYNLATGRLITGLSDDVRRYRWADPKTLQYWPLTDHVYFKPNGAPAGSWHVEKPALWHLPG